MAPMHENAYAEKSVKGTRTKRIKLDEESGPSNT